MDIISTRTVREMNMAAMAAPNPNTMVATAGVPVTGHTFAKLLREQARGEAKNRRLWG